MSDEQIEAIMKKADVKTDEILAVAVQEPVYCDVCASGDSGIKELATGLWRVPGGCIALPGQERQALCRQHELSCTQLDDDRDVRLIRNVNGYVDPFGTKEWGE